MPEIQPQISPQPQKNKKPLSKGLHFKKISPALLFSAVSLSNNYILDDLYPW
jgi:hypothetical protein